MNVSHCKDEEVVLMVKPPNIWYKALNVLFKGHPDLKM